MREKPLHLNGLKAHFTQTGERCHLTLDWSQKWLAP